MTSAEVAGGALAAVVLLAGGGSRRRLHALAAAAVTASDEPRVRRESARRLRAAVATASLDVPFGLSLELRSGRDLPSALLAVAEELASFGELSARLRRGAAVAASGGDLRSALTLGRNGAPDRVGHALQVTGACCSASLAAGLPLADLLDAAAGAARSGVALSGKATAELAGSRSTAMVLAALPVAGLAMGGLLGARPWQVLLGTPWGAWCLVASAVLTATGLLWSKAITAGLRRAMP
jgi:tight adherence protein B